MPWPYPPDSPEPPQDNGQLHHLPGSTKAFRMDQIYADGAVDWFPEMHPKPPAAVIDGKPGAYFACGSCHLMSGNGKPDMQSLNAMPVAYMQQQLEDMKKDLRHTSMEEPGADRSKVAEALVEELLLLAKWLGFEEIEVTDRGVLAAPLKSALQEAKPRNSFRIEKSFHLEDA